MQFQQIQQAFVDHIKDPVHQPAPEGIEDRRMAIYRELFFNNVQGFVSTAFPVLKSLYTDNRWQNLIRQFFIGYQCSSPYFLHIAEHFLQYLQQDYPIQADDPAFLLELAHYEWAELYLATMQQTQAETALSAEQVLHQAMQLSQLSMLVAYPYQVHRISTEYQPAQSGDVQCYLLYRNDADEVKFILINPLTAALVHSLQQHPGSTLTQLVQQLSVVLPQYTASQLQQGAAVILQDFAAKGAVVSFQVG